MCQYCERRTDIKHGWNQPKLPYHGNPDMYNLSGNIADFVDFEGVIHDYQTTSPQLILTCHGYFSGTGVGMVYIPIKYCPECGRKLGKNNKKATGINVENNDVIIEMIKLDDDTYVPKKCCTFTNPATSGGISFVDDVDMPCGADCENDCSSCVVQRIMNEYAKTTKQVGEKR